MSRSARPTRPFPVGRWLLIPAAVMALMLVFDTSALDFWFSGLFYVPGDGFVGRHSFFLEDILHDRVKQAVILIGVLAIIGFLLSLLPTRLRRWRPELGYLVLSLALATSLVTPLKQLTNVPCPWSLVQYGGTEIHTPLLSARPGSNKAGRCWPGGHASSGFSLLALFFALRDRFPRAARGALIGALALGSASVIGPVSPWKESRGNSFTKKTCLKLSTYRARTASTRATLPKQSMSELRANLFPGRP